MITKADIISQVSTSTEASKKEVTAILEATFEAITQALANGENVQIYGFGTFEPRDRAARVARNPRTGENIQVPAAKFPGFKPGKALKNALNPEQK